MIKIITSILLISITILQANENSIKIEIPKVPEVPKVEAVVPKLTVEHGSSSQTNDEIIADCTKKKVVIFSDRVAPFMLKHDEHLNNDDNKTFEVGDLENGRVTAYLHGAFIDAKTVETTLQTAGFDVLSTYKVDKKGYATSLVFTNKAMQDSAAKIDRGFAGTLRVTVDKKNKLISISNPIYVMKAFMQEEYNKELAQATLKTIRDNFKDLKNSTEVIKFRVLERFQFMEGMPKYNDMISVGEGKNAALLKKAKKSKKLLYSKTLSNGSIIVGLKLGKRTTKFIKKVGYQNAGLLPYPVLIEDGKAKMLDPKYYIAVMYPMLKMSQFMTISTVPGAITKDIGKIFR